MAETFLVGVGEVEPPQAEDDEQPSADGKQQLCADPVVVDGTGDRRRCGEQDLAEDDDCHEAVPLDDVARMPRCRATPLGIDGNGELSDDEHEGCYRAGGGGDE